MSWRADVIDSAEACHPIEIQHWEQKSEQRDAGGAPKQGPQNSVSRVTSDGEEQHQLGPTAMLIVRFQTRLANC